MYLARRQMLRLGIQTAGMFAVAGNSPSVLAQSAQPTPAEPHFFLEIFFPGGMDSLYTFDSRPLALTAANRQVNYMTEEPDLLTGANGQSALVTALVKPLLRHFDRFSVLNGVVMASGFDGHDNNTSYFDTGDAFGGESLLPHLNSIGQAAPLDVVKAGGGILSSPSNANNSVALTPSTAAQLAARLRGGSSMQVRSPLFRQLRSRLAANGQGPGRFSAASAAMVGAFEQTPVLGGYLASLEVNSEAGSTALQLAQMSSQLFIHGVCRSVQLGIDASVIPGLNLDTHDAISAAASPKMVGQCINLVSTIFEYLRATPYDDQRSLLDVTTVLVGSEFGRGMRHSDASSVHDSGTDHNSLKNTLLLGGKGIRAGLVVGATDQQTVGEVLSEAHKGLDPEAIKAMGRPFDFALLRAAPAWPDAYRMGEYLDFACVANTVYKAFGAGDLRYRRLGKNGPAAVVLNGLLS